MHPRIIFPSIETAHKASPFFIDEEGVGPWLGSSDQDLFSLGVVIHTARNAIHIPSLERTGKAISGEVIADICQRAASIGLNRFVHATGYWTLESSGILQTERVKIAFSEDAIDRDLIRGTAKEIVFKANQEAVAIEIEGLVEQIFSKP